MELFVPTADNVPFARDDEFELTGNDVVKLLDVVKLDNVVDGGGGGEDNVRDVDVDVVFENGVVTVLRGSAHPPCSTVRTQSKHSNFLTSRC